MGQLIDGTWHDIPRQACRSGAFVRGETTFRDWVTADGSSGFPVEADRYHLYVAMACPWAHRTLIFRKLKGLEKAISVSCVDPLMLENGWTFGDAPDPLTGASHLYEVYTRARPDYTGRVSVPVLWDKRHGCIVNNESADIIRMMNGPLAALGAVSTDYYPADLAADIDAVNARVYAAINNGVYRAGFAATQHAYEDAVRALFTALDELEVRLASQPWLVGERQSEADWRLFTTLIRFDAVYFGHFKCNLRHIYEYRELWDLTRALYQTPGIAGTVAFDQIKLHYYGSHHSLNPTGIVPLGPSLDLAARARRGSPG
jgi:glutathionyl-hydroquinone reductase